MRPWIFDDPDEMVSAFVRQGDHLHFAATMSRANALVYALARTRRGRHDVTVSMAAVHSSAHALALSGAVKHMITGFLGDTYPLPRPNPLYADLLRGQPFTAEVWPLWTLMRRLSAAGSGAPAVVSTSLLRGDLRHGKESVLRPVRLQGGEPAHLLPPLRPDLTLVHAVIADRAGNLVLGSPEGEGPRSSAAASRGVLATAEHVVDDLPAGCAGLTMVPGHRVRGLCEAEQGAHPQSLPCGPTTGVSGYDDDYAFLAEVAERCRAGEGQEWYEEWVQTPGSHRGYLRALSTRTPRVSGGPPTAPDGPTEREQLIVLGARAVADVVRRGTVRTVLAGIGHSHLAAWLAGRLLEHEGAEVQICAELGFYDMRPSAGDVYLFAPRHAARAGSVSSMEEVMGGIVTAGADSCLGVLSAGEIDERGNVNTAVLPSGRWMTGPGGACDIASATACVVVAQARPSRYVRSVHHVTSPGDRMRTCVSQYGRFERTGPSETFSLTTWLAPPGEPSADPARTVTSTTGWAAGASAPAAEAAVTRDELDALRALDPTGVYR
ncbi:MULTISPECIES: CoA-transferase [unclassified Streptomyces]|uniref:CoA-transferase n=1 Tax=Streptomyces sp. NPDC127532 TaxID=3345399 RepID=UPI00362CFE93